jgi:mono/diheme cytochrome c family protein
MGLILIISLLLLPFLNCSGGIGDAESALSSASNINTAAILESLRLQKTQILSTHCVSCHNQDATDNQLKDILNTDFLDANNFINLGSPQTSPLYLDVVDGIEPPGGGTLSQGEIAILRDWIAAEGGNFNTYIGGSPVDPGTGGSNTPFTPVRTVLRQNCTSCHSSAGRLPNLDVDGPTLRATVYNGSRLVVVGDPNGSLLYQAFARMPDGQPLGTNSAQAGAIRTWIANGAL